MGGCERVENAPHLFFIYRFIFFFFFFLKCCLSALGPTEAEIGGGGNFQS